MSGVGFEPTPPFRTRTLATIQTVKKFHLDSGALDRSAILTAHKPT